jgi:ribose 5-phosphate isomerase A
MAPTKTSDQIDQAKRLAAEAAMRWVHNGMTLGLGSGSTAQHFIRLLGERVRAGALTIEAVASSRQSEALAQAAGILLTAPRRGLQLDLAVDGADEITPDLDLIKGRGGALLREKILVQASRYFLVIADSSKRVPRLGKGPVPLEVVPFAVPWVADRVQEIGGQPVLRMDSKSPDKPYCTDQENYVLDCRFENSDGFSRGDNPRALALQLEQIPGVVEHGLFLDCAQAALIAEGTEVLVVLPGRSPVRDADFPLPS